MVCFEIRYFIERYVNDEIMEIKRNKVLQLSDEAILAL